MITRFVAVVAILLAGAGVPGFAAAPADLIEGPAPPPKAETIRADRPFDTEIVVRNWIVCISRGFAEDIVHARERGVDDARKTYAELKATKSCGRFSLLRVVLKEAFYAASLGAGEEAAAFSALVDLSSGWANAFVVSAEFPAE